MPFTVDGSTQLFGHGHPIALLDQPRDVIVGGMIGHTRQRHALSLAHRARGEHDVEFARDEFRIGVEGLVEIAEAEE